LSEGAAVSLEAVRAKGVELSERGEQGQGAAYEAADQRCMFVAMFVVATRPAEQRPLGGLDERRYAGQHWGHDRGDDFTFAKVHV
jgi:hypothetical protein